MKGFIKQLAATSCFGAALFTVLGCTHYRAHVDPCWPERYNVLARQSVRDMSIAQSDMGHKLDQTIWNHHFDPGTDNLNPAGRDHLRYLSRRMPVPDHLLWVQYPHDVAKDRDGMVAKRKDAIKNFLSTQTGSGNGSAYHIAVHDHAAPTHPSEFNRNALQEVEKLKGKQWVFEEKDSQVK